MAYTTGRQGNSVEMIVLHHAAMVSTAQAVADYLKSSPNTSAHYAVDDNEVVSIVAEDNTAYHAGNWDVNLKSIGIEMVNDAIWTVSNATIERTCELCAAICNNYGLNPETAIRWHREFSATQCPSDYVIERIPLIKERIKQLMNPVPTYQRSDVIAYPLHGGLNQRWKYLSDQLINCASGRVLDLHVNDRTVTTWHENHKGENQKWLICDNGLITSKHDGNLVLDVNRQNNNKIIAYPAHGGVNQQWRLWKSHTDNTVMITCELDGVTLALDEVQ